MSQDIDTIASLQAEIVALKQRLSDQEEQDMHLWRSQVVLDQAPDSIHWVDMNTAQIVYANDAMCKLLGYTKEELLAMRIPDIDPSITEEAWDPIMNAIRKERLFRLETSQRHKDGYFIEMEVVANYLPFRGKEYVCSFGRNITERKQIEEKQRQSQAFLQSIIDGIPAIISITDLQGTFLLVNTLHAKMFNMTTDEMVGKSQANFLPPEKVAQWATENQHIIATGESTQVEDVTILENGLLYSALVSKFPLYDEQEKIYAIGTVAIDITKHKKDEKDLRIFKSLVENALDGVVVANFEGKIIYANNALKELMGYDDVLTLPMTTFHAPGQSETLSHIMQQIQEHGAWKGTYHYCHRDGTDIPANATINLIHDASGNPIAYASIIRDIREQLRQEEERLALQQQLIDVQQESIRELSTPLIPLSTHVVLMPLVGNIDSTRAQQVMETLLEGIATYQADVAIVDITGVSVVDTQVANALVQTAQAVRLLGAQIILTGIGPTMAQTLIHLGADLSGIQTRGSLQSAIVDALVAG